MQREFEHGVESSRAVRPTQPLLLAKASDRVIQLSASRDEVGPTTQIDPTELRALLEQASRPKQATIVDDSEPAAPVAAAVAPPPPPPPEPAPETAPEPETTTAPRVEAAESSLVGRTLLWFLIAVACFAAGYWA